MTSGELTTPGGERDKFVFPARAALRVLKVVLADPDLTFGERVVTAAVILQADRRTGRAWASYRNLHSKLHVGGDVVAGALRAGGKDKAPGKAVGRYLRAGRKGRQGAQEWMVIQQPSAQKSRALRKAESSAQENRIQRSENRTHSFFFSGFYSGRGYAARRC